MFERFEKFNPGRKFQMIYRIELIITKNIMAQMDPKRTGAVSRPIRRTSTETKQSLVRPI